MLLVMLIVSLFAIVTVSTRTVPLSLFMRQLENRILLQQIRAYAENESRELEITSSALQTPDGEYVFPQNTVCTPFIWHYTGEGTISEGGTVTCTDGQDQEQLVFRIGAGRFVRRAS